MVENIENMANDLLDISSKFCSHYVRKCALVTPCCNKIYRCRLCHNVMEGNHELDRKIVERIKCLQCGRIQSVAPKCSSCSITFGLYYCETCRLFDDNNKGQFHCVQCGLCRVGGRENYKHCNPCGICFKIGSTHKCIEQCSSSDCPICLEDLHSHGECQKLNCGHLMHVTCLRQLCQNFKHICPLCATKFWLILLNLCHNSVNKECSFILLFWGGPIHWCNIANGLQSAFVNDRIMPHTLPQPLSTHCCVCTVKRCKVGEWSKWVLFFTLIISGYNLRYGWGQHVPV